MAIPLKYQIIVLLFLNHLNFMTIFQYSYNVLIGFFKNYLTVVPDCTASWPLLHDIGLKNPQHFRYSYDGCLKEASLLVN